MLEQNEKCWNINKKNFCFSFSFGWKCGTGWLGLSHCVCAVMWGGSVHQCQKLFFQHTENTHPHVQSCCIGSRTTVVFCFFSRLEECANSEKKNLKTTNGCIETVSCCRTPKIVRKREWKPHTLQLHNMVVCKMEFRFLSCECIFFGNRSWKCSNFKLNKKRKKYRHVCVSKFDLKKKLFLGSSFFQHESYDFCVLHEMFDDFDFYKIQ